MITPHSLLRDDGSALLPARRPLPCRPAGDEAMIHDPASGQVHFLNPTAALVWECCDGHTSISACEDRLRQSFDIPEGLDLAQDIRDTIADFARQGLLDEQSNPL